MATLAVFLFPEKVGIARVKAPGFKPSYSSVQWRLADNVPQLLDEPLMLASLIREMVGDEEKYNVYLNVWPGAYNAVMFSYDKKGRGDLDRLRRSELETVFHGELHKMYTMDLPLSKGKPGLDGKCHRIIFTFLKDRVHLIKESLHQQRMTLKRIAPMDVTAAEGILEYWDPKDEEIHVAMVLDEGCTSISFIKGGIVHAIRTIPNGFGSVLSTYKHVTGLDHDTCLEMIRTNGVNVADEGFDMPAIQDDVMRMLNRIAGETVKTLHNTFGDEAVIGKILLCGNFVGTVGLVEYLNTMLNMECIVAGPDTLSAEAKDAIVLEEKDLNDLFILAATTAKGSDLMYEMKKALADKIIGVALCTGMTVLVAGIMALTPFQKAELLKQRDALSHVLDQPEYATVSQLINERSDLNWQKTALEEAIANLPHGSTNAAGIITSLYNITEEYGVVQSVSIDYTGQTISLNFTTLNYDYFIYWQKEIVDGRRFSFVKPATFNGNGLLYNVNAVLKATDFSMTPEELAVLIDETYEEIADTTESTEAPSEAPTEAESDESTEETTAEGKG